MNTAPHEPNTVFGWWLGNGNRVIGTGAHAQDAFTRLSGSERAAIARHSEFTFSCRTWHEARMANYWQARQYKVQS